MTDDPRKLVVDPTLPQLCKELKSDIFASINCVQIGTIQSFDPAKQTASIQLMIKRIKDLSTGETLSYPVLVDCPVYFPGGTDHYIMFPVKQSDECLVLFNDRDIDNWFTSGTQAPPNTLRMHNLSDGFAYVGFRSLSKVIAAFDPLAIKINNSATFLKIKGDKMAMANTLADFYTIFNSLMDALINAQTSTLVPLSPATIAALTLVKTTFAFLFQAGSV